MQNWFQNRRARVKADIKKEEANRLKNMNMYASRPVPMATGPYPIQGDQLQTQPQPMSTYYAINADISPTSLPTIPVESIEMPSGMEPLGQPQMVHSSWDLGSIPETDRPDVYNPNTTQIYNLTMAASAGPSFVQSNQTELPPQENPFQYDLSGLQVPADSAFAADLSTLAYSVPSQDMPPNAALNGFSDWSGAGFDFPPVAASVPAVPTPPQDGTGTVSSEPSPFSNAQSMSNTQSAAGPTGSSVASLTSVYTNWPEEPNAASGISPASQENDGFDPYSLGQASVSEQALPIWTTNGQISMLPQKLYMQNNASAQAIMSSTDQNGSRKMSAAPSDLETPPAFGDEYSRRNSSATNLVNTMDNMNMDSVAIQSGQSSDYEHNSNGAQPSTIASRRRKRPAALNPSTLRSGSYSSGMPSPGVQSDHTLRRIRSSGLPNAGGRVQKPTPGSAQRSPLAPTFAEAAASPKFVRTLSGPIPGMGQGGSLAPPTPLSPSEMGRWQSNTVFRSHQPMPEDNSPQSLNVSWSVEPQQNGGVFPPKPSPPSTPSAIGQMNQARFTNGTVPRDTPPQSAPATQQTFPNAGFMPPPRMNAGFRSTTDLSIVPPKPLHFRRPSLPDTNHSQPGEAHMQFPVQATNVVDFQPNYDLHFNDTGFNGLANGQTFQQQMQMHQFMVQEYSPPQGNGQMGAVRRPPESQPKNYIFANQGPHDFR